MKTEERYPVAAKRSIYLINPKFQIKFCLFVSSLVFVSSLIYPIFILEIFTHLKNKLTNFDCTTEKIEIIQSNLQSYQGEIILYICIIHLLFTAVVFIFSIFQSHKIAGPVYKLKKYLQSMKEGIPAGHLFFRKGDNFHDIADDFNQAFNNIRENHEKDFLYLTEVNQFLKSIDSDIADDKKSKSGEIRNKLIEIQERYKQS